MAKNLDCDHSREGDQFDDAFVERIRRLSKSAEDAPAQTAEEFLADLGLKH